MDDLVSRVTKAILDWVDDGTSPSDLARAILPIVYEDAARIVDEFGKTAGTMGPALATRTALAQSIRSRVLDMVK